MRQLFLNPNYQTGFIELNFEVAACAHELDDLQHVNARGVNLRPALWQRHRHPIAVTCRCRLHMLRPANTSPHSAT